MRNRIMGILLVILCVIPLQPATAGGDPQDQPGSKDPALFSRMPGFYISTYEELEFDRYEFWVSSDKTEAMEGRRYYLDYYAKEGVKVPSGLQITRNYADAAKVPSDPFRGRPHGTGGLQ